MRHSLIPANIAPSNRTCTLVLALCALIGAPAFAITVVADSRAVGFGNGAQVAPAAGETRWLNSQTPFLAAADIPFTAGTNGILIATIGGEGGVGSITSATWNGVPMTAGPGIQNGNTYSFVYYLLNPQSSNVGTGGVVFNLQNGVIRSKISALYATGVAQEAPEAALSATNAANSTTITLPAISVSSGALVVSCGTDQTAPFVSPFGNLAQNGTVGASVQMCNPTGAGSGHCSSYILQPSANANFVALWNNNNGQTNKSAAIVSFKELLVVAGPPTITSITPTTGPNVGGFGFTITGTELYNSTSVQLTMHPNGGPAGNTVSATNVSGNGTSLTYRLPPASPTSYVGQVDLTLTNAGFPPAVLLGDSVAPQGFSYTASNAPTITSLSVIKGPTAGGTALTINGTGFAPTATVTIGGAAATGVTVNSNSIISITTPAGTTGQQDVVVTNPDAQTVLLAGGYTYINAPTITPQTHIVGSGNGIGTATLQYFNGSQLVTLATNPANAAGTEIYFTTDGSAPVFPVAGTTQLYTGAFTITQTTTVRAIEVVTSNGTFSGITGSQFTTFLSAAVSPIVKTTTGAMNYVYNNVNALAPYNTTPGNQTATGIVYAAAPDVLTNFQDNRAANTFAPGTTQLAPGLKGAGTLLNGRPLATGNSDNSVPNSAFQARFTGTFTAPTTGVYTLAIGSDDGSQLFIDEVLVVANNVGQGVNRRLGQIGLLAGQHAIRVDWSNTGGGFGIELAWDPTGANNNNPGGLGNIPNTNLIVQAQLVAAIAPTLTTYGGTSLQVTLTQTERFSNASPTGSFIFYTTDGTTPTFDGNFDPLPGTLKYTAPFAISGTTPVTAIAAGPNYISSAQVSRTFQNVAPSVASITPALGPPAGGQNVTIAGANFSPTVTGVTIGGVAATSVVVVNSTSITAVTGLYASTLGVPVDVIVTNNDAQTNPAGNGLYTYTGNPTITSIAPTSGTSLGGTPFTLSGTNFAVGFSVTFNGVSATSLSFVDANTVTGVTPPKTAPFGAADVGYTGADLRTVNAVGLYTYVAAAVPTVTSVSPSVGPSGGGTVITISGTNFAIGATVRINGVAATAVTVVDDTTIMATTPPGTVGSKIVLVANVDGQSGSRAGAFTYLGFQAISLNFNGSANDNGQTVPLAPSDVVGAPVAAARNWNNANGTNGGSNGPATNLVDAEGTAVATTVDWAAAENWNATNVQNDPNPNVRMMRSYINNTANGSTYFIRVNNVPAGFALYDLYLYNNTGQGNATRAGTFTLNSGGAAVVNTFTPDNLVFGPNTTTFTEASANGVTPGNYTVFRNITSGNFANVTNGFEVLVFGSAAESRLAVNGFQIIGHGLQVVGVTPGGGPISTATPVTIKGAGFVAGASLAVTFGGEAATAVTFVDANTITATTPNTVTTAGLVNVVVTNGDGLLTGTLVNGFAFLGTPPTLTSIVPSNGPTIGGTVVTVTGTDFLPGLALTLNGVVATVTNVTPTSITATSNAALAGTGNVTVQNSGDVLVSGPPTFTYTAVATPVIAPNGGNFTQAQTPVTVTLTSTIGNIFYTLDGSTPSAASTPYTVPFPVTGSALPGTVLRAIAINAQGDGGNIASANFVLFRVPENPPVTQAGLFRRYYRADGGGGTLPNFANIQPFSTAIQTNMLPFVAAGTDPANPFDTRTANWSVQWTGYVTVPESGIWSFFTNSDDGSRLFIDNTMVANNNFSQGANERGGQVALQAGTHLVKVQFGQGGGGFQLDVRYSGPNQNKVDVPTAQFSVDSPNIVSVSPPTGSISGNTSITITGSGFSGVAAFGDNPILPAITINGVVPTNVVIVNDTTITADVAPGAVGPATIVLQSRTGPNTSNNTAFAFALPAPITWTGTTSSLWSVASNWDLNRAPQNGDQVILTAGTNAPSNLDLANLSVSALRFNNTTTAPITVTPSGAATGLTLAGGVSTVNVTVDPAAGNHVFAGNLALNSNSEFVINTGRTFTVSGIISGVGNLSLSAGGILTLPNAANSYTGKTTVVGSTLNIATVAAAGVDSSIGAAPAAAANLVLNSSTLRVTGAGGTSNRGLTLINANNVIDTGTALAFSGTAAGSGSLTKIGSGALTLSGGGSSYLNTTVSAGSLISGGSGSIGTGTVTLSNNTALTLGINGSLSGFGGNGTGWTQNGATGLIVNDVATVTTNGNDQGRSVFFNTAIPNISSGFVSKFTYTVPSGSGTPADGFAFIVQNSAAGATALGGTGGAVGYAGINQSFAMVLAIYVPGGAGIAYGTNGAIPGRASVAPVNLLSGNDILVTVSYNGTTMTTTLSESNTANTFTFPPQAIDLAALLGGGTGFVGFSGGTGGENATQVVKNFELTTTVPIAFPTADYKNPVVASGETFINVVTSVSTPLVKLPSLTLNANAILNVGPDTATAILDQPYNLTIGSTTLTSPAATIRVAMNGAGIGTLIPGTLSDGGTATAITVNDGTAAGTLNLTVASTLNSNTSVQINGGVVRMGVAGALGAAPRINIGAAGTLDANNLTIAGTVRGLGSIINSLTSTGIVWPGTVSLVNQLTTDQVLTGSSLNLSNFGKLNIVLRNSNTKKQSLTLSGNLTLGGNSTLSLAFDAPTVVPKQYDIVQTGFAGISEPFTTVLAGSMVSGSDYDVIYFNGATQESINPGPGASFTADRIVVRFNSVAVTPVTVESFTAQTEGAGVLVSWNCVSEYQNAGFNVYRRALDGSAWSLVNPTLIPGRITNPDPKQYALYDWVSFGSYEYKLESVSVKAVVETHPTLSGSVSIDPLGLNSDGVTAASIDAAFTMSSMFAGTHQAQQAAAQFAALAAPLARSSLETAAPSMSVATGNAAAAGLQNVAVRNLSADTIQVAQVRQAARSAASTAFNPVAGVRWFSSSRAGASSYAAVKVVYVSPGVMLIPRASLPAGFDVNQVSLQREGRSFAALAITPAGLLVHAPGYQDDYTDKDVIFLRRIAGNTAVGSNAAATGLFASSVPANVTTASTVRTDYHDVYFDYDFRPYSFEPWFSSKYLTQGSTQNFDLTTPLATSSAANLTLNLWSLTQSSAVSPDHALQVLINNQPVAQTTWDGGNRMMRLSFTIPSNVLTNGTNTVSLVTPTIAGQDTQIAFLHSMEVSYTRLLDGAQSFTVTNSSNTAQMYELHNIPAAGAYVVDTRFTDRAALVPTETLVQANGTLRMRFMASSGGSGQFLIVPVGQESAPLAVNVRQIKPARLNGTYLMTGPSQFSSGVRSLLLARSREGVRGAYVDQEDIFNYYNHGRFGPTGIQKAVRSLRPQYLLLLGRTTYDYRNYTGANVDPLCPTFLVSTSFWAQATSDSMFGDFGRGYPEVAVGRLPVNNASELNVAVQRILSYKGPQQSGVAVHAVADTTDPAAGNFAEQAGSLQQSNPELTWQANYLGTTSSNPADVTNAMTEAANGGADWLLYVGHGNAVHLGSSSPRILDVAKVQAWTGNTIFLQSTCTANWMAKDEADYKSIAIQALTQPQGGIAASIASSTYLNSEMTVEFMNQLIRNTNATNARWGNVLMRTQQWASQRGAGFYSDLSRTEQIFGDPAMRVHSSPARIIGGGGSGTGASGGNSPSGTF